MVKVKGKGKVCRDWSIVPPHFGLREPCLSEKDSPRYSFKSILSNTLRYLIFALFCFTTYMYSTIRCHTVVNII